MINEDKLWELFKIMLPINYDDYKNDNTNKKWEKIYRDSYITALSAYETFYENFSKDNEEK